MAFWRVVSTALAVLLVVQWILFSVVLSGHRHDGPTDHAEARMILRASSSSSSSSSSSPAESSLSSRNTIVYHQSPTSADGVAATLMLQAPKWFHRRYTVMLHNALANIPDTWKVQVFVNTAWLEKDVLPLHPGLRAMYRRPSKTSSSSSSLSSLSSSWTVGRVTWTPLPANMTHRRTKPKEIMKSRWLWESVMAENVLLFGGNGALCANSKTPISDFLEFDYVGTPWTQFQGRGGDGSTHSFRHRSAMLSILQKYPPDQQQHDDGPDFQYFVRHLLLEEEKASQGTSSSAVKVADRQTTLAFGGVWELDQAPFLLSGIQANLNWTMRDNILMNCPELKVIFPSMHEPSCFGAHPNGAKCKESICALQDKLPPQGC